LAHTNFKRKGNDLLFKAEVTLRESLFGSIVKIPLLSGQQYSYNFKSLSGTLQKQRIPAMGMPLSKNPNTRGDLLVKFELILPTQLSTEQKALLADVVN
jgi:DnaJ-class molecular chaperone